MSRTSCTGRSSTAPLRNTAFSPGGGGAGAASQYRAAVLGRVDAASKLRQRKLSGQAASLLLRRLPRGCFEQLRAHGPVIGVAARRADLVPVVASRSSAAYLVALLSPVS